MPRRSSALLSTDREVAGAKPPSNGGKAAEYRVDGTPNLVLRVWSSGRRTWSFWLKRRKTDRWQKYSIGAYPTVSLALARQEAQRLGRSIIEGIDPIDARNAFKHALTVRTLGESYIKRHAKPKKRSWEEDERKLKKEVYPVLGSIRAEDVAKTDLVRLLNAIVDRGAPIQGNRTLALLRKLFNFAVAEGYLERSPAQGIPSRANERIRTRTLKPDEIAAFWLALGGIGFDAVTADALRLQLLLGARVREITGMRRNELALDNDCPIWTLPKERAKGNRDVPRPLPDAALAIVRRRLAASPKSEFVFASPLNPKQCLTPRAPSRAVQRAGERGLIASKFTPHDLRRTCRTGLAELGVAEIVAKKILGHAPLRSDVTASVYDQHDYLREMHAALERWEMRVAEIVASTRIMTATGNAFAVEAEISLDC